MGSKKGATTNTVQVPTEAYYNYKQLRIGRFLALYQQIKAVFDTKTKKILEVGMGNGNTALILKNFGLEVTTCDFDKTLNPDYLADIRKLPFREKEFETVIACEILEHIPFEDFELALTQLKRVSKKYVIISIPNSCISLGGLFHMKIPFIGRDFSFSLHFPYDWLNPKKFKFNGEHYWEMGRKNYSKRRIRKILRKHFRILKEFPEINQPEHYFFVLENI